MPDNMYQRFFYLIIFLLAGCGCTQLPKQIDNQSAVAGDDLTSILSGCGQQITVGYLVCRQPADSSTAEYIEVHAPPNIQCDEESCVYFKIFYPDGRPTYESSIKKGESHARVKWSSIIDKQTFDVGDRGFYAISLVINYKDSDGNKRKTYADGYLFLHVVRKDYVSLLENEEDEHFVWSWKSPTNQTIKMTTGYRLFVSPPNRNELRSTQKL